MPTINWIGKDKVVNHHLDVPFYTLEHKYGFRAEDETDTSETHSGNMIIQIMRTSFKKEINRKCAAIRGLK